jgi:flavoprotein
MTGSGHCLKESLALAAELPNADPLPSRAAEEVLPLYKLDVTHLKERVRVFLGNSASAAPVGRFYQKGHAAVCAHYERACAQEAS